MKLSQIKLIVYTSLFLVIFDNYIFFANTLDIYTFEISNLGFILSLILVLSLFLIFLFTIITSKKIIKLVLIVSILISSISSYFMNNYHIIIDTDMIRNIMQTNIEESFDLFSVKLLIYFLVLGLIPSVIVYNVKIISTTIKDELLLKLKIIIICILIILSNIFVFSKFYTSFFREHKSLRFFTNPTYWIYSIGKYMGSSINNKVITLKPLGLKARVEDDDSEEEVSELIILVVGEAARADHFSLNGYEKETNPLLAKEDIVNFSNMYSCGTSTAVSVPCMFSVLGKSDYSYNKAASTENVLDVLSHTDNVNILWRDNNSDSKGVALRVTYENYRIPKNNTICDDGECRDEGMLVGLDEYVQKHKGEDILIVLHQMGNHGPAYYKRYPKKFEKFTPACKTNQLEKCSKEEISNAYDNAILYTDYFLSKTINFLKKYDNTHSTSMIYISDHGESLGENGVYLHGLPYFMAPESQTHVSSFIWFGNHMKEEIDLEKLEEKKDNKYTQDNLFHILLGIFEVEDDSYKKELDFLEYK